MTRLVFFNILLIEMSNLDVVKLTPSVAPSATFPIRNFKSVFEVQHKNESCHLLVLAWDNSRC